MASIKAYLPIAAGLSAGAATGLGVAAATAATSNDNSIAKLAQYVPVFFAIPAFDVFKASVKSAGRGNLGNGAQKAAVISSAIMGAGAMSGMSVLLNTATKYNTIDPGLNNLERESFVAAHRRRSVLYPLAGAIGGAALAFVPALRGGAAPSLQQTAAKALIGGGVGVGGAIFMTTQGQKRAYRPSTEDAGIVADSLWRGINRGDQLVKVDPELAGKRDVRDGAREYVEADQSRFYAIADANGNSDGILTPAELRAHVASFDSDGDGRLSFEGGEWAKLHTAVVEDIKR
jgi:hypothetical protein